MNNLLELGGSVDLIATAICDFETPIKKFKKGDVVLDIKNVHSQLITSSPVAQGKTNTLSLEHAILTLNSIQFPVIPLEQQIYGLLGEKQIVEKLVLTQEIEALGAMVILNEYVEDTNSIRINGLETFEVQNNKELQTTIIVSDKFTVGQKYAVQYEKQIKVNPILLDSQEGNIPYLKLQLKINGNKDKQTWSSYVLVEKASMRFNPSLIFTESGVTYCSLFFNVIHDKLSPKPRILMW